MVTIRTEVSMDLRLRFIVDEEKRKQTCEEVTRSDGAQSGERTLTTSWITKRTRTSTNNELRFEFNKLIHELLHTSD